MLKGGLNRGPACMAFGAVLLGGVFVCAAAAVAQREAAVSELEALPPGVTLPVKLGRSRFVAGKVQVGTPIVVTTTQEAPVESEETYLKAGAELDGEVVASVAGHGNGSTPATLSIRFTRLRYGKQSIPLRTKAIAIANFMEVGYTHLPTNGGSDMGIASEANWADEAGRRRFSLPNRLGGPGLQRRPWESRRADYYGVYSLPTASPDEGHHFPALWGYSPRPLTACMVLTLGLNCSRLTGRSR